MSNISIIVPTLNEEHYLPRLLGSISSQNFDGTYEILIIDAKSTDKTRQIAKGFENTLPLSLFSCEAGVSKQRNYGESVARYDNLLFVDADMHFSKDSLGKIAEYYVSNSDFIATPKFMPYDGNSMDKVFAYLGNFYFWLNRSRSPVLSGMCIITTKNVFKSLNGFDEDLLYAEDIDFGLRAFKKKYKYKILSNVIVESSTRRLQTIGRFKLGVTWLQWHIGAVRHGVRSIQKKSLYPYGAFNKK